MKKFWIGMGLCVVLGAGVAGVAPRGYAALPAGAAGVGAQDGTFELPWMQPPAEFKEVQRRGFHAGVQAAVKDYDKHRDPDIERHKEYVKPKVDHSYVPDWRDGYKRGYNDAYKHLVKTHGQAQ